jgi:hypothetical protein
MYNFTLELTLEEQAIMVLWEKVRPHVTNTNGDYEAVMKAIAEVIQTFSDVQGSKEHWKNE